MIGTRVGMLIVVVEGSPRPRATRSGSLRTWWCKCDCGAEKEVLDQNLRAAIRNLKNAGTRSCGCLVVKKATKHGAMSGNRPTPEYEAWKSAKKRCYNPGNPSYKNYGARGIRMCDEWLHSFETFLRDVGERPRPDWSLDRTTSQTRLPRRLPVI